LDRYVTQREIDTLGCGKVTGSLEYPNLGVELHRGIEK